MNNEQMKKKIEAGKINDTFLNRKNSPSLVYSNPYTYCDTRNLNNSKNLDLDRFHASDFQ